MSRITDGPIVSGDALDAASLNTRFSSYTQTDLNQFNHRDAAHDLPQFQSGWLLTHAQNQDIGLNDWRHTSSVTVNGMTAMPANPHPIEDGAGTPTDMSFGAGLTIANGEVLRVYWNLSAKATQGSNWNAAGSLGYHNFNNAPNPDTKEDSWGGCWVFYLEWDITSSSRTNYVPVPGQGDFKTTVGSYYGDSLSTTQATSVMPSGLRFADEPTQGLVPNSSLESSQRWRGISGAWYYPRTVPSSLVVYGIRVVVKGVLHPYKTGSVNYLVHDTVYSNGASLEYNGGNLAVLKHRVR